jgi:hypothetical protein
MTRATRSHTIRCVECRQSVNPADPATVSRVVPRSLLMRDAHREVTRYWHTPCWEKVEQLNAECRVEAAAQRTADMWAYGRAVGMSDEAIAEKLAELTPTTGETHP